jgi:histidinol phosphatase-like PHP family hydrolase/predicted phosphodiesterase
MRIAVISDMHFHHDRSAVIGSRRAGISDLLQLRAVHRLNRFVRPDLVVVLGDIVDDSSLPETGGQFQTMRRILDLLRPPWIALPGNHDGAPERFFRHFPPLPAALDIAGVRCMAFVDPEEPGYNARRQDSDLRRMASARSDGWKGPVVMLQHVPLFPPGRHPCPYNYINATDVMEQMERSGITVAVSGHYHAGFDLLHSGALCFAAAPALCEAPFSYLLLDLDGGAVRAERHSLAMPADLGLTDVHLHTNLAYCNENMDIPLAQQLAQDFGLAGLRFTEHSGHLYFSRHDYGRRCFAGGMAAAQPGDRRMPQYLDALRQHGIDPRAWGIEIDADAQGEPLLRADDSQALPFRLGAIHDLDVLHDKGVPDAVAASRFLIVLERFLTHRLHVLAHPFRVFRRAGRAIPQGLFEPTVRLLKKHGTAAEVNFHTNDPDPAFVRLCIDNGVPLAFGSDAHNLYEVGEFFPHLALLRQAGYDGAPGAVTLRL